VRAVRTALGEPAFAAAWDAGRVWPVAEAITFARTLRVQ
jgi:hypothetical protein